MEIASFIFAAIALIISLLTFYLTIRRGTVEMTQPMLIVFAFDTPKIPKIFLRTLLFSTSKRGRVLENMYIAVHRHETHQNFSVWGYGLDNLVYGSGMYIGESGVENNHHFLVTDDASSFQFSAGEYHIEIFAKLYGDRIQKKLFTCKLTVDSDSASKLLDGSTALYFTWSPTSLEYLPRLDQRNDPHIPEDLLKYLSRNQKK